MNLGSSKEKSLSFFSIGTPRGVALTSLNKYSTQAGSNNKFSNNETDKDDSDDIIASLKREKARLVEELSAEKRRSESLKQTFSKSLAVASAQQKSKLACLRDLLQPDSENPAVKEALKYIGDVKNDTTIIPDTPRVNELAKQAQDAENSVEKLRQKNQKDKKKLKELMNECDELRQQLDEINTSAEQYAESMHELKDKFINMKATLKKRDAQYKERIAALEAELGKS